MSKQFKFDRLPPGTRQRFQAPKFECYACHDSGIVVNGDGAVNKYFDAAYDRGPAGEMRNGHDMALICTCKAARNEQGYKADGQWGVVRHGFIEDSGQIRTTGSEYGTRSYGYPITEELRQKLHNHRVRTWAETEQRQNLLRAKAEAGTLKPEESPGYLIKQLIRDELKDAPRTATGFSSIGQALTDLNEPTPF